VHQESSSWYTNSVGTPLNGWDTAKFSFARGNATEVLFDREGLLKAVIVL